MDMLKKRKKKKGSSRDSESQKELVLNLTAQFSNNIIKDRSFPSFGGRPWLDFRGQRCQTLQASVVVTEVDYCVEDLDVFMCRMC